MSLDLLAADLRVMAKGLKEATGELVNNKTNESLKVFCIEAEPKLSRLQEDFKTSKVDNRLFLCMYNLDSPHRKPLVKWCNSSVVILKLLNQILCFQYLIDLWKDFA